MSNDKAFDLEAWLLEHSICKADYSVVVATESVRKLAGEFQQRIAALLAQVLPDGYVAVPRESLHKAVDHYYKGVPSDDDIEQDMVNLHAAVYPQAAPSPPAEAVKCASPQPVAQEKATSGCPECGSPEIDAGTPRTVYECFSSDYDQRPGTFIKGSGCP